MVRRLLGVCALVLVGSSVGVAQTHQLSEQPKSGESFRFEIETTVSGSLKIKRDGKGVLLPLSVKNQHTILEKVLTEGTGVSRKVARHYEKALSTAEVNQQKSEKTLREDRKLIVAQRMDEPLLCYSPVGPLQRSELELVAEHFDTLHLTGILPGKGASINDTWKLPNATVQTLCLFEGLLSNELEAKLSEVKEGSAFISIEGKASGIELGAMVNLNVRALAKFDLLKGRLTYLDWRQKDQRDQGPASPAADVESVTLLRRTLLTDEPKELSKTALASVPAEDSPNGLLKQLQHRDHQGRYTFLHDRDWHVVGTTDSHLVLRLLDRGDFMAQANLTWWKKAEDGKHLTPDEFKKIISLSPGWELEEILESSEIATDEGRWLYRITAKGDLDGIKVIQNFFCLANGKGDQMIVTFTMKPGNVSKIGTRDVALVNSIELLGKK
jgi:hypothetical protein